MPWKASHPDHEMTLKCYKTPYSCAGCKMDGHGERFCCTQSCNCVLHKECMNPAPTRSVEIFPGSTFKFLDHPPPHWARCKRGCYCKTGRACDVCGMDVQGFVYHSKGAAGRDVDLDVHPVCAMLKRKIRVDDVEFELKKGVKSRCNWCKQRQLRGTVKEIPGLCYVSKCSEYSFHVCCLMNMVEFGSTVTADRCEHRKGGELAVPDGRLREYRNRGGGGGSSKFVRVVKFFLKIALSVFIGDPTAIIASLVVELFSR